MKQKTFSLIAGVIFLLIALGHLSRIVFKLQWLVAGWAVPFWVNWVAMLIAAYLAFEGIRLSKKSL